MSESTPGPVSRPPSPEVLAALKELQAEYAKVLPKLVGTLAEALRRAKSHPEDPVPLEEVRAQAHKLRGSAGSYGFFDVGDAAVRMEEAAIRMQKAPPSEQASSWPDLESAMADMTAAAERTVAGLEG